MNDSNRSSLTVEQCGMFIHEAKRIVAMTGAGISTAAGIPDFRGPNGLYTTRRYDPDRVFDITYFRHNPGMFYRFTRDFISILKSIQPTWTHRFLARLESEGILSGVITQNIDTLHHLAGSKNIIEVHGSYWNAGCIQCDDFKKTGATIEWWEEQMTCGPRKPVVVCPFCSGIVKPEVVFFGEPVRDMDKAEHLVTTCDLLLVLGSSLTVYPAALLPRITSAPTLIINRGEVCLEGQSNRFFIDEDLDIFLKKVVDFIDSEF